MKLLCFSDLHRDQSAARRLAEQASAVDALVGAGDFGTLRRGIDDTIEILAECRRPAILVAGNSESAQELRAAAQGWPEATVLHGSGCELAGVPFWGLGGAVPETPFGDWSWDLSEDQAAGLLADSPAGAVLVVHSPPLGSVDRDRDGTELGSQAIRDAIIRLEPPLVVCGHIHAGWGTSCRLGRSLILNAGPTGQIVDLENLGTLSGQD